MTIKCEKCGNPVSTWDESGCTHAKCEKCGYGIVHISYENEKFIDEDQWLYPIPSLESNEQIIKYLRDSIQHLIGDDEISAERARAFKIIDTKMGYKTIFTQDQSMNKRKS